MEYMKTLPDNAFDLAVVDPPYGAGFTEGGGCKGWFSKYHQDSQSVQVERDGGTASAVGSTDTKWSRFGQRFNRYKKEEEVKKS